MPSHAVTFNTETVSSENAAGFCLDYDPSDNRPAVIWNATSSGDIRYSKYNGSSWDEETISSARNATASPPLWLKFAPTTQQPYVVFIDHSLNDVIFSSYTGTGWSTSTVTTSSSDDFSLGLAVDDNDAPYVSWVNGSFKIQISSYSAGAWNNKDTGYMQPVLYFSLDYSGYLGGSYNNHNDSTVRFSSYSASSGNYSEKTVKTGINGNYTAMAFDPSDGKPAVAYYNDNNTSLEYAKYSGGTWSTETVVSTGDVGKYCSLAFDPDDNNPAIAYYDDTNDIVKYAKYNGTSWSTSTVYEGTSYGAYHMHLRFDPSDNRAGIVFNSANDIIYAKEQESTPPSDIADLSAQIGLDEGEAYLTWTNPGDDGGSGNLTGTYKIAYSSSSGTNPGIDAAQISVSTAGAVPGNTFTYTVTGLVPNKTHYFWVWSSDDVPNWSGVSNRANCQSQAWKRRVAFSIPGADAKLGDITIDNNGVLNAVALENLHIVYASMDASDTDSPWPAPTTIGNAGGTSYQQMSIAVDIEGNPFVTFFDGAGNDLMYSYYNGSSWSKNNLLDSEGTSGVYSSVLFDPLGKLHIAYRTDPGATDLLKYACGYVGSFSTETVQSDGTYLIGRYCSIQLAPDMLPHIAHIGEQVTSDLWYKFRLSDGSWSDDNSGNPLVHDGDVCWSSLALDGYGKAYISYDGNVPANELHLYTNSSGSWVDDSWSYPGRWSDIVLDGEGSPVIASYDNSNGNLELTWFLADVPGGDWDNMVVEEVGDVGKYCKVAIDAAGHPHILYTDNSNAADGYTDVIHVVNTHITLEPPMSIQGPTGFSGVGYSSSSIQWSWTDNASNELGYRVRVSTPGGGSMSGNLAADLESWIEYGLSPNTTYQRYVQVYSTGGICNSTTTIARTYAAVPGAITFDEVYTSSITLSWADGSNPSGTEYEVSYSTDNFTLNFSTPVASTTDLSYAMEGIGDIEQLQYFRVRAINEDGIYTDFNTIASTQAIVAAPDAIDDLAATETSNDLEIRLNWTAPGDDGSSGTVEDGSFRIRWSTTAAEDWDAGTWDRYKYRYSVDISTNYSPSDARNWTVTGLQSGATYYFRIWAFDEYPLQSGISNGATVQVGDWFVETVDGSTDTDTGRNTALAIDENGTLHATYLDWLDSDIFYRYKEVGSAWSAPELIQDGSFLGTYPSAIAINNSTIPVVVYYAWGGGAKYTDRTGGSWAAGVKIDTMTVGQVTSIVMDPMQELHMPYDTASAMKHVYSIDGDWYQETADPISGDSPNIALDSKGLVHLVYYDSGNQSIKHAYMTSSGTWASETVESSAWNYRPSIRIDGADNIHLLYYNHSDELVYNVGTPGSWSPVVVATGDFNDMVLYLDGDGNANIFYYDGDVDSLIYAENSSGWSYTTIETESGVNYQYTSMGISPSGVIHAVYYENNKKDFRHVYKYRGPNVSAPLQVQRPSSFSGTVQSTGSINWTWIDNSSNETGFKLRISTPGGMLMGATGPNVTSYNSGSLGPNTTYYVHVQAYNTGSFGNSASDGICTEARMPQNTHIVSRSSYSVTLQWDPNGNPAYTRYELHRSTDNFATADTTVTDYDTNYATYSYIDSELSSLTSYWYKVRAINEVRVATSYDSTVSTITLDTLPFEPASFSGAALNASAIKWNWADVSNENGYRIYSSTSGGSSISGNLAADTTYWVLTSLSTNTQHTCWVEAFNGVGTTTSTADSVYTSAAQPGGPSFVSVYAREIEISWTANGNPGATRYELYRSTDGFATGFSTPVALTDNFTNTEYTDTSLSTGTAYTYRVSAFNGDDVPSIYSGTISTTTLESYPGQIADLSVEQDFQLSLSWTAPGNDGTSGGAVSSYIVKYSTAGTISSASAFNSAPAYSQSWTPAAPTSTEKKVLTNLTAGVTYWFAIKAVSNQGYSPALSNSEGAQASHFVFDQFPLGDVLTGEITKGHIAFGDMDGDGDLDIVMQGEDSTNPYSILKVIENVGGIYSSSTVHEPLGNNIGLETGEVTLGDYDNDGDLDIAASGRDGSGNSRLIVLENVNGTFSTSNMQEPMGADKGVQQSAQDFIDYDNDGDLDLAVIGYDSDSANKRFIIFENYNNTFSTNSVIEPYGSTSGVWRGDVRAADFDNDGDMDLIVVGNSGVLDDKFVIFINENGSFSTSNIIEPLGAGNGYEYGSVEVLDYNGDGALDISATGSTAQARVYENVANSYSLGNSQQLYGDAPYNGALAGGEYDNDGDSERFMVGDSGHFVVAINDSGTFTRTEVPFGYNNGVGDAAVALADYDGDNDLDVAILGNSFKSGLAKIFYLYRSVTTDNNSSPNSAPAAPSANFSYSLSGSTVTIEWGLGGDTETSQKRLFYAVQMGTSTSDLNTVVSGVYGSPLFGNYIRPLSDDYTKGTLTLKGLAKGSTYYWKVRAIDEGFLASSWSGQQSFYVPIDKATDFAGVAFSSTSIKWNWTDNETTEDGYRIFSSTDGLLTELSADTTHWVEYGLSVNTAYQRYVQVYEEDGYSNSGSDTAYTYAVAPETAAVSSLGVASINLSWDRSANPAGTRFGIVRSTDDFTVVQSSIIVFSSNLTAVTCSDNSIISGTTYYYRIFAYNGDRYSTDYSNKVSSCVTFTAAYSISGYVRDRFSEGVSGVTVSGTGPTSTSTVTGASGYYSFNVVQGSYTITCTKTMWSFSPGSQTQYISDSISGVNVKAYPYNTDSIDSGTRHETAIQPNSGEIKLVIPENTFSRDTVLTFREPEDIDDIPGTQPDLQAPSRQLSFEIINSDNLQPQRLVTVTLNYRDSDISNMIEGLLILCRYDPDNDRWLPVETKVYENENRLVGYIDHFSKYQVLQIAAQDDLDNAKVYPNPFYMNDYETVIFGMLTSEAEVKIFTISGQLVRELEDENGDGRVSWNGENDSGNKVASGVYLCLVESDDEHKTLRLIVVR